MNMSSQNSSFVFYESFRNAVKRIKDKELRLKALEAILDFGLDGTVPDDDADMVIWMAIELVKPIIESNKTKRINGAKGGRGNKKPVVSEEKPMVYDEKPMVYDEKPMVSNVPSNVDVDVDVDVDVNEDVDVEVDGDVDVDVDINTSPNGDDIHTSEHQVRDRIPYQEVVDNFNEVCVSLPKVQKLTESRKQSIKGRCNEYSLNEIYDVFRRAERSDFLTGRVGNWRGCSFDWLLKPSNFVKVLEGNYENNPGQNNPSKINGHDELDEFYAMTAAWAAGGDDGG